MFRTLVLVSALLVATLVRSEEKSAAKKVDVGSQAPAFKIKDANGKEIDLAALTAKGPVLVRLVPAATRNSPTSRRCTRATRTWD